MAGFQTNSLVSLWAAYLRASYIKTIDLLAISFMKIGRHYLWRGLLINDVLTVVENTSGIFAGSCGVGNFQALEKIEKPSSAEKS